MLNLQIESEWWIHLHQVKLSWLKNALMHLNPRENEQKVAL